MNKTLLILILITIFNLSIYNEIKTQSIINLGKFPVLLNTEEPLKTSRLLEELEWEKIKKFSQENEGHYAYEREDSLKTEYEYVQQGRVASFEIVSFNGKVLDFYSEITNTSKPSRITYFDKNVWVEYVNYRLPNIDEKFKISAENQQKILKAYYTLLGVDSRDEYGWICEYSTVGRAPKKRSAVIDLLNETELLINLLDYPNIQTKLYVIDALIYEDYRTREMMKKEKDKEFKKYLESTLLSKEVWKKIYEIRDSEETVKICGNVGSYKIYQSNTTELLSEKAIDEIVENYEILKQLGYFR